LAAVVQTAHERGLRVVAPCVESVAEVERLRATGIDLLQGNHFRPPANNLDEALPQVGT
jgi:EAL domain-containing protein (putative c-di-GMP-specific phosphodiesterase class I)